MRKTTKKTLLTIEALNIVGWLTQDNSIIASSTLPIKVMWDMRKNVMALEQIREQYNKMLEEVRNKYMADEYSTEGTDEDGQKVRIIKDEYKAEWDKAVNELLGTENEIEIKVFDIEDFGDIEVSINDLNMLSFFFDEEDEDEAPDTVEGEVVD